MRPGSQTERRGTIGSREGSRAADAGRTPWWRSGILAALSSHLEQCIVDEEIVAYPESQAVGARRVPRETQIEDVAAK